MELIEFIKLYEFIWELLSWDDKNRVKFIGKTNRLMISLQNAYLANFVCFFNFPDRNLIIWYKIT